MQLNLYIPKGEEGVVRALERVAREQGRRKNEVVLDALRKYLRERNEAPQLGVHHLGVREPIRRSELYEDRLDRQERS